MPARVTLANRDGQRASMELVRQRLARLAEHPPGCCQLCVAAAKASAADVYKTVAAWLRQTTVTRARALL